MTTGMCKGLRHVAPVTLLVMIFTGACEQKASAPSTTSPGPPGPSAALPADPNQRLDALVRDDLDATLAFSPTTATWLGVHGYDDRLDDVRPEAQAREASRLHILLDRLHQIDAAKLDEQHRVDQLLLERRAQSALWELTELRPLEKNPIYYVDLANGALADLIESDPAIGSGGSVDRVRSLTGRLWKIRPLLDEARHNLRNSCSDLSVRKAAELAGSLKVLISETLPRWVQVNDAKQMDDFRSASGDASRALDDFIAWLQKDLLPRARGDFALGRERLADKLRLTEGIEAPPELLVALGERELRNSKKRWDDAAKQVTAGHPGADPLKLVEEDHAKPDDLLAQAQAVVESVVAFAENEHLMTLPAPQRPRVVEMPPVLWGFVQLDQAAPLDAKPRDPHLYVDPVEKEWLERRKQEHLRVLNHSALTLQAVHDVLGHYVQGERNRRAPTTEQKIALAPAFLEGWANYVEVMAADAGLGAADLKLRLVVERSTLLHAARLVAAVKLHAQGAKIDDAVKVFTDEALLDEFQARREAERAAVDPLVMLDALGRLELEKLRDDYKEAHPGVTVGAVHDAMLAHGSPPVTVLRKILLPDDKRSPL
jgi:uncharacterized protein (DUF885 family)